MKNTELRVAASVAFIFFCRMMGLFMVLPILSLYGNTIEGASLSLIGLALGIYGLSQAFLQIPFALCSDVFGRKRVMLFGLSLFLAGSLLAMVSDNIWMLILSRFLQGSGAIAGTSMALLADHSGESSRTWVMAIVGIAIGASFVLALIVGPIVAANGGLQAVFAVSSCLAFVAILVCLFGVSDNVARQSSKINDGFRSHVSNIFRNTKVYPYALGVFVLHLSMTSSFVVIPMILEEQYAIDRSLHGRVYLLVFFIALILMGPFARPSTDISRLASIYKVSAAMMSISLLLLAFMSGNYYFFIALLCIFFCSFNLMEALLPAMLSIEVDAEGRAGSMGVFSTFQFMGAFFGAWLSGICSQFFTMNLSFVLGAVSVLAMLFLFVLMQSRSSGDT